MLMSAAFVGIVCSYPDAIILFGRYARTAWAGAGDPGQC